MEGWTWNMIDVSYTVPADWLRDLSFTVKDKGYKFCITVKSFIQVKDWSPLSNDRLKSVGFLFI